MLIGNSGTLQLICHFDANTPLEEGIKYDLLRLHVYRLISEQHRYFARSLWVEQSTDQNWDRYQWIKALATSTTTIDTRVFLFAYRLHIDGSSLWNQLLGQSDALIEGLNQSRTKPGVRPK